MVGSIALALLVLLGGLAIARSGTALPGTLVEGRDVGGLGRDDLRDAVQDLVTTRQDATVAVTAAGHEFDFTPGSEGYGADIEATVDVALAAGRGGFLGLGGHVAATFGDQRAVELQGAAVDQAIARFVTEVAETVDQPMHPGNVRVDPDSLEVRARSPRDGVDLDADGSIEALTQVVGLPDPPAIQFPAEITPTPTTRAALEDAVSRAERAVADGLVLTANGGSATLSPSEIARVLRTREQDGRLTLVAHRETLAEVLEPDLPAVEVQPRDATFQVLSGLRTFDDQGNATWAQTPADVDVVPGEDGHLFAPEMAARQVGRLLDDGVREAELELKVTPPDLPTDEAEGLGIDNLIGTFTTYHSCCQNRVKNIHRMADLMRGQVLRPDESISINDHVGQRTIAKGFVADGAIFQGEIRDEVGGGVSQFATTMYNASFFAGVDIVDWRAHSLYISRYPLGREATLNYDSIDLEIRNNTDHGLYIHTSYTDTSITVSLFGDTDGRTVRAVMGSPYNYRDFDTRTRNNSDLPRGQRRVVQSGERGYQVTVQRVISGGGIDRTEKIVTTYQPKPTVIEIGTGDPPPPKPSPSATESEKPKSSPSPSDE